MPGYNHSSFNDVYFAAVILYKRLQKWPFHVQFSEDDDEKLTSWLHFHKKLLYSVTNTNENATEHRA